MQAHRASPRTRTGTYSAIVGALILKAAFKNGATIHEVLYLYHQNTAEK